MENRRTKIILLCVLLVGCVLTSIGTEYYFQNKEAKIDLADLPEEKTVENERLIKVYVSGAVQNPGLYDIAAGSRACDAVEKAGGFTETANLEKVNLAKKLKDGSQVNVPSLSSRQLKERRILQGEIVNMETGSSKLQVGKVNINTADAEELDSLPGIGMATARKIIDHRSKTPFGKPEDLLLVDGIGSAKFAKLKDRISI